MKKTKGMEKQKELLQALREVAHEEAEKIANELDDNSDAAQQERSISHRGKCG